MAVRVYLVKKKPVRIWGLTSSQRIERVLKAAGYNNCLNDMNELHSDDTVLILRADYLFDDRLVTYLAATPGILVQIKNDQAESAFVAAHVSAGMAGKAAAVLENRVPAEPLSGVQACTPETLPISFHQRIKKAETPFVLPISPENKKALEKHLFLWSYKGVTDLVTKWAWPIPARNSQNASVAILYPGNQPCTVRAQIG